MSNINAAVIGCGLIGPVHVEGLKRAGVNVTGICGVDEAEGQAAAAKLNLPRAYRDVDELLADGDVHSVHVCTPNKLHYGMVKAVLEAGKHVVCEKPLAMNAKQSAELVELARQSGKAAMVNYNLRFYPLAIEAAQRVKAGDVGEIYHVTGSYVQDWLFHETDYNWRLLAEEGGQLRAVSDVGTHWLDMIHTITGVAVEAVCADLKVVFPIRKRPKGEVATYSGKTGQPQATEPIEITTEDYGCIMLKLANGGRGVLYVSQVTAGRKNCLRFEIAGSKCALAFESEKPNEMWIGHRERPNELLLRDPSLASDAAAAAMSYPGGHNEGFPDTFKQAFGAFYGYIEAGDFNAPAPFATFDDGHREIVLCDAILQSHQKQAWVSVG